MKSSWQSKFPGGQPYHLPMLTPPLTPSQSHSAASAGANAPRPESYATLPSNPNHFHVLNDAPNDNNGSTHQARANVSGPNPPSQTDFATHAEHVQHQHSQHQHSGNNSQKPVSHINEPVLDRRGGEEDYARTRRRAQNRAAQHAFRERKEKYVKDLEAKIAQLEAVQRQTSCENERLKKHLHKMSMENAILRITSPVSRSLLSAEPAHLMRFNSNDLPPSVVRNPIDNSPSCHIGTSIDDESLLAADAAWDFIIGHRLFKKGLVDIRDLTDLLKHCARYDGQGPVFSERTVISAIEQSVTRRTDNLI